MKRVLMLSAAAALLMFGGGPAWADHPANACGLNHAQLTNGWTCVLEFSDSDVQRTIAPGNPKCQSGTQQVAQWVGYNPAGNANDDHSGDAEPVGDPEWYGPPAAGACED